MHPSRGFRYTEAHAALVLRNNWKFMKNVTAKILFQSKIFCRVNFFYSFLRHIAIITLRTSLPYHLSPYFLLYSSEIALAFSLYFWNQFHECSVFRQVRQATPKEARSQRERGVRWQINPRGHMLGFRGDWERRTGFCT